MEALEGDFKYFPTQPDTQGSVPSPFQPKRSQIRTRQKLWRIILMAVSSWFSLLPPVSKILTGGTLLILKCQLFTLAYFSSKLQHRTLQAIILDHMRTCFSPHKQHLGSRSRLKKIITESLPYKFSPIYILTFVQLFNKETGAPFPSCLHVVLSLPEAT